MFSNFDFFSVTDIDFRTKCIYNYISIIWSIYAEKLRILTRGKNFSPQSGSGTRIFTYSLIKKQFAAQYVQQSARRNAKGGNGNAAENFKNKKPFIGYNICGSINKKELQYVSSFC